MSKPSHAILITGCSTGIGHATALRLARAGHVVYATAREESTLSDLRDAGARTLRLDVTNEPSMRAAVDRVVAEHGAVGVLVNNAGYSQSGAIESVPMDAVRRQFETNVIGLINLTQLVLPGMRAQRYGRIVNVSSVGANFTFPGGGLYHATKYALEAISDALRFEVSGFGIAVIVVQPGLIRTAFAGAAIGDVPLDDGPYTTFNAAVAATTVGAYEKGLVARLGGEPDDVARVIEKAITSGSPRVRVRVTTSAHLLFAVRRLLGAALWDRFVAGQFPRPGRD